MKGKVVTVQGPIAPEELGPTLTHEHIFLDISCWFEEGSDAGSRKLSEEPVSLKNLWWIKRNPLLNRDNVVLTDYDLAVEELMEFKKFGGNTLVDVTNIGIGRDPYAIRAVSIETGINIVMGSGYYVTMSHPEDMSQKSVDDIAGEIVRDVKEGVGSTGIRAGIIGEIGITDLTEDNNEEKSLRGAVRAQRETGAPLSIHPPLLAQEDLIFDILNEEKADFDHTIMCHMGIPIVLDYEFTRAIAEEGVYIGIDGMGFQGYLEHPQPIEVPSDSQRIRSIKKLLAEGFQDRIILSHDICRKDQLMAYGGFGYAHILRAVIPMMRDAGISEDAIRKMTVDNPRKALAFR